MNVLIVYETYSGGTQVTTELIASLLKEAGHQVETKRARDTQPQDLNSPDLILFGSPSWLQDKQDGQPHQYMGEFLKKLEGQPLTGKKFALFGLGDHDFARFTHAVDIMSEILQKSGATQVHEPLRLDSFHFKQEESEGAIQDWTASLAKTLSLT